jgi:hypothetical protein
MVNRLRIEGHKFPKYGLGPPASTYSSVTFGRLEILMNSKIFGEKRTKTE